MTPAYKFVYIRKDQEHNGKTISQNGLVWREISCCDQLKTDQDGGGSSMKQLTLGVRTAEDRTDTTSTNEIRHVCLYTAKLQSINALRSWFVFRPTKGRRLSWLVVCFKTPAWSILVHRKSHTKQSSYFTFFDRTLPVGCCAFIQIGNRVPQCSWVTHVSGMRSVTADVKRYHFAAPPHRNIHR